MSGKTWGHDELAEDLAVKLRQKGEIVETRQAIGSGGGRGQMDVLAIRPSWSNLDVTCYEVKVSRSDFNSDVSMGKYLRYLPYVHRVVFAMPNGLVTRDEIPSKTGLITRSDKGWYTHRRGTAEAIDDAKLKTLLLSVAFKQAPAPWRNIRQKELSRAERIRQLLDVSDETEWRELTEHAGRLGKNVSRALHQAKRAVEDMEWQRQRMIDMLDQHPDVHRDTLEEMDFLRVASTVLARGRNPEMAPVRKQLAAARMALDRAMAEL